MKKSQPTRNKEIFQNLIILTILKSYNTSLYPIILKAIVLYTPHNKCSYYTYITGNTFGNTADVSAIDTSRYSYKMPASFSSVVLRTRVD